MQSTGAPYTAARLEPHTLQRHVHSFDGVQHLFRGLVRTPLADVLTCCLPSGQVKCDNSSLDGAAPVADVFTLPPFTQALKNDTFVNDVFWVSIA